MTSMCVAWDAHAAAYLKTADPTRTRVVTRDQVKHAKPNPDPAKMVNPYIAGES
jgi:hypothetical protein